MDQHTEPPTERTRLRRRADRGRHDFATVAAILDEGMVCHVGFAVDGRPWVFPTAYARLEDRLYVHGASGNFALRALASGTEACVTVTLVDGLVLARSAFHHSMNYRSVMIFGRPEPVLDDEQKRRAVTAIVEHLVPGRSGDTRPPTPEELRATRVVGLRLDEASAKVRTGDPVDEPEDVPLGHWAGQLPLHLAAGDPVAASDLPAAGGEIPVPGYLRRWTPQARRSEP